MTVCSRGTFGVSPSWRSAVLVLALSIAACSGDSNPPPSTAVGALGIFDPAVTLDPAVPTRVWMSYSIVDPVTSMRAPWGVGIRLRYTDNGGTVWNDNDVVSAFQDVTVLPGISVTSPEPAVTVASPGIWQSETSTVVYDPNVSVQPGERWKMLYHRILWANNIPYYVSYSWIEMKQASTVAGLAAATPVKLFGGSLIKNDAPSLTNTVAPIGGAPAIDLNTKHADLTNCGLFGEPSLLATSDTLYMALDCQLLGGASVEPYVVMFKCTSPCIMNNLASWTYLGRVTTPADATAINSAYKGLSAPALTTQGGKYYLITTPVATIGDRYDGCRVYEFADLTAGLLKRDGMGQLLPPVAQVTGISDTHNGACAHHAALSNGILHSQLETNNPPQIFRIYQSGVNIP
jgi:hypothetical protein